MSKRISLTNAQKRQLCLDKAKKPTPTNGELASKYGIKEKTVSAILIPKEKWLVTNSEESPNSKRVEEYDKHSK